MNKIDISKIGLKEIKQLQKISQQTFYETFSPDNTEENLQKYFDEELTIEKLTAEVNNKDSQFYFATFENSVIGYLKINLGHAQTEIQDYKALEIERIYVTKEYFGKEVGQLLFNKALQIAEQEKVNYVWLGVWEKNARAIRFYEKNGFVAFDKHIFKLGNDKQTDIMMKRKLTN